MGNFTSYSILVRQKLIICNYQGRINIKDVIQLTDKFIHDPDFDVTFDVLIDFRNSSAIGFRMDITDYMNFFKKSVPLKGTVKVGILYSTPNQEYLLKIYRGFSKLLNLDIEIFKPVEPCMEWMGFEGTDKEEVLQALASIKSTSADLFSA